MTRELLLGSTRVRRDDEPEVEGVEPGRIEPGKLTTAELREHRTAVCGQIAPGKLTLADAGDSRRGVPGKLSLADVGRGVSPALALHRTTAIRDRRIERDAEHDGDVDEGTLASAFSFIDSGPGGTPLPAALAARLGAALRVDLSRVRLHTEARAAAAAAKLRARAFTIGEDVYFAAGAYDPVGASGVRLIAHEVAHVAQNYRGTAPTTAGVSRPGDGHEREADRFADRFATRPLELPWLRRLEQMTSLPAAQLEPIASEIHAIARHAMVAGAGVVREIVKLAPASPARKRMIDELGRVTAPAPRTPGRGQIHRDLAKSSTAKPKDESTLEQRFDHFVQKHKKVRIDARGGHRKTSDGRDRARFGFEDSSGWVRRYWHSSEDKFQLASYQTIVKGQFKTAVTDQDLQKIFRDHRSSKRVAKVGHSDAHSYAWLGGDVALQPVVIDLKAPKRKSAAERWAEYSRMVEELQGKKALLGWSEVVFTEASPVYSLMFDPDATNRDYYANKEADWFLRELVDKVAADPNQATSGEFRAFYRDVCVPWSKKPFAERNPGLIGSMFEQLAKNTLDPESPNRPVFFHGKGKHRYLRRGDFDAIHFDGVARIIEVKAYTKGPSERVRSQLRDYASVVGARGGRKVPGYERLAGGVGVGEVSYDKVVFVFPTQRVAQQWYPTLLRDFRGDQTTFETIPKHTGKPGRIKKLRKNPVFEVALPNTGKRVDVKRPPVFHPGLEFRDIHLELDGEDTIQRGRVHTDLDLGGAVQVKNQPADVTPSSDPGIDGQIANDYRKAESKIESLLGTIQPSVKVTDKGVRATLTLPAGKSKLPGLDIERGELAVAFEDGKLSVGGEVVVIHHSGKFRATLAVGYAGASGASRPPPRSRRA
ncbi:MAG: DUF4157 domain-containing protein [Kofleriaceae bacterium]